MHSRSSKIKKQAPLAPPDDGPAQLIPTGAAAPEILANRELFLDGLIARGTRVHAPNPVKYTDTIIAVVLAQWGALAAKTSSTSLVEVVDPISDEEKRSAKFAKLMQRARDLKKLEINIDTAVITLLSELAAIAPNTAQIDLLIDAIHKATRITKRVLKGLWKPIWEKAQEAAAAGSNSWDSSGSAGGGKFHMGPDGLYRRTGFNDWERISQSFEVLGLSRDNVAATESNRSWSTLIRFQDRDQRTIEQVVEHSELVVDFGDVLSRLVGCGMEMSFDISARRALADYIYSVDISDRVTRTRSTGWIKIGGERAFVLPDEIIGSVGAERVILDQRAGAGYAKSGTLEQWRDAVAVPANDHLMMRFSISISLSGPLLEMGPFPSGIWHIHGNSGAGKTTMQRIAASVWGSGLDGGYMKTWRTTANAMEATLSLANDTVFVVDEIGQADSRELGQLVYMVAGSQGKSRMRADASLKYSYKWREPVFSTGEVPISTKIGEEQKGKRAYVGQLVRAIDIPETRALGVFDLAGPGFDPNVFAKGLEVATGKHHGTAGPEFVRQLIERRITSEKVRKLVSEFVDKALEGVPKKNHGQAARVAERFGVVAVAGKLAVEFGIATWSEHQVALDALELFKDWLAARGGAAPAEIAQMIAKVRRFIEAHGDSHFDNLDPPVTNALTGMEIPWRKAINRAGFRKGEGEDQRWFVLPEAWRVEVCAGFDPREVAKTLAAHGMLDPGEGGKMSQNIWIFGSTQRVYVLKPSIFEAWGR